MGIAGRAADFGPAHEPGAVVVLADRAFIDGCPETRPAGARIELGVGGKQRRSAADAAERPLALLVVERVRERPLGPVLARDVILLGRELASPFLVGLGDFRGGWRRVIGVHFSVTSCVVRRPLLPCVARGQLTSGSTPCDNRAGPFATAGCARAAADR